MKAIRRPMFWFGLLMWGISFALAVFLVQLGAQLMSDVPTAGRSVQKQEFVDTTELASVNATIAELDRALLDNQQAQEDAQFRVRSRALDHSTQLAAFEAWIKTRNATQSEDQNPEVTQRVALLEKLKMAERDAVQALNLLKEDQANLTRALQDAKGARRDVFAAAEGPYARALQWETLKVFLLRLALTLPLLAVSAWLIARRRTSPYWPLYRAFILFSLFAFFVELVPYLPSYGGYVRIIVGIALVCVAGHFCIRYMRQYLARKQAEEAQPEAEKRKSIAYEQAVKKIAQGVCPSCDRQFRMNAKSSGTETSGCDVDFCVHCGFSLFRKCGTCGTRDNSFFKFCGKCGDETPPPTHDSLGN